MAVTKFEHGKYYRFSAATPSNWWSPAMLKMKDGKPRLCTYEGAVRPSGGNQSITFSGIEGLWCWVFADFEEVKACDLAKEDIVWE